MYLTVSSWFLISFVMGGAARAGRLSYFMHLLPQPPQYGPWNLPRRLLYIKPLIHLWVGIALGVHVHGDQVVGPGLVRHNAGDVHQLLLSSRQEGVSKMDIFLFKVIYMTTGSVGISCPRARKAVLRIHDILVLIRIRRAMPLTKKQDPDPVFFVIDLQDANQKLIF